MLVLLAAAGVLVPVGLLLGLPHCKSTGEAAGWLLVTLVWSVGGVVYIRRAAHAADAAPLGYIFFGALGIRLVMAVIGNFWAPPWMFAEDDGTYDTRAWMLARQWLGSGLVADIPGEPGFVGLLAALYACFGRAYMAGLALNVGCGACVCVLAYQVAVEYCEDRLTGVRAACVLAVLPSMVIWSAMLVRDVWTTLLILSTLLFLLRVQGGNVSMLPYLVLTIFLVSLFRSYLFLALVVGALVTLFWPQRGQWLRRGAIAVAALAGFLIARQVFRLGESETAGLTLARIQQMRQGLAVGGSSYLVDVDLTDPASAAWFLPVGVAYFLLGPFPWMIRDLRQMLTVPDLLVLYACLFLVYHAVRFSLRTAPLRLAALSTPALIVLLAYSLVSANMGTAYRHRAQILPPLVILASVGMTWLQRQRQSAPLETPDVTACAPSAS